MAIRPGRYFIESSKYHDKFVGLGAVPPTIPPWPSPLRVVHERLKDTWVIQSKGGDSYTITHQLFKYFVGSNEDGVKLIRNGEGKPVWAIDPGNSSDLFRIKLPNEDKYWTASEEPYGQIELQGANGDDAQQWKLVPIERD